MTDFRRLQELVTEEIAATITEIAPDGVGLSEIQPTEATIQLAAQAAAAVLLAFERGYRMYEGESNS